MSQRRDRAAAIRFSCARNHRHNEDANGAAGLNDTRGTESDCGEGLRLLTGTRGRGMTLTSGGLTDSVQASPAAHAVDLRKTYGAGQAAVHALAGINVTFERGRFTAVMGPSGSGKSTLMHCMAGLDRPTSGQTFVGGQDVGGLDDAGLTRLRRDKIGFVFQSFNLVPTLSAAENITLPADLAGTRVDRDWLDYLVKQLGIGDRLTHRPSELSGGQQQRVACARALINRPEPRLRRRAHGQPRLQSLGRRAVLPQAVGLRARPVDRDGDARPHGAPPTRTGSSSWPTGPW